MIAAIGMGLGAAVWLVFELWAAFGGDPAEHPTTYYVRKAIDSRYGWAVRVLIAAGLLWAFLHFEANLP